MIHSFVWFKPFHAFHIQFLLIEFCFSISNEKKRRKLNVMPVEYGIHQKEICGSYSQVYSFTCSFFLMVVGLKLLRVENMRFILELYCMPYTHQ